MIKLSLNILVADWVLKYLEDDANRYGPLSRLVQFLKSEGEGGCTP